ncbi:hypothetical protein HK102_000706, partial [Quaeritorhiza haematococci]
MATRAQNQPPRPNPLRRPKTFSQKFRLWKLDLDRTQGYELEGILGRLFDRWELYATTRQLRACNRKSARYQNIIDKKWKLQTPSTTQEHQREDEEQQREEPDEEFLQYTRAKFLVDQKILYLQKQQKSMAEVVADNNEKLKAYCEARRNAPPQLRRSRGLLHSLRKCWSQLDRRLKGIPPYANPAGITGILRVGAIGGDGVANRGGSKKKVDFEDTGVEVFFEKDATPQALSEAVENEGNVFY